MESDAPCQDNLHRAELTKLERDDNIAEWIKITERVSPQSDGKPQGRRPEGGINDGRS